MAMNDKVRELKRERILNEAVPLFAKFGFQNVTLDRIAKRLKVTKPFIYTYFANKDALLEAIYDRAVTSFVSKAKEIIASDPPPEERLRMVVELYVLASIKGADVTTIFLTEEKNLRPDLLKRFHAQHHDYDAAFANLIKEGDEKGIFNVDEPRLAGLAISGMVRWVHRWYRPAGRLKPEQFAGKMSTLALNVVGYRVPRKRVRESAQETEPALPARATVICRES
jgi:AcrR family transcriptional regulator